MERSSPTQPLASQETSRPKGRLLVVDDEDAFRSSLSRMLQHYGYECVVAADAASGLELLRNQQIDTLISDINMPGNGGLALVQKAQQVCPGLPVILLTGQPEFETAKQSVRLSVAAYLTKPPDLEELLSVVAECVARYRQLHAISSSRQRVEQWAGELKALEERLRHVPADRAQSVNFLRLTLHHVAVQLAELASATAQVAPLGEAAEDLEKVQLLTALQQTISVLENTRKHFKSKELADLRKQLTHLLAEQTRGTNPAS